mmetsp:Transcript_33516/g.60081  ORF Transcript_33516/g.60081 Transcript_33516/m.60081 type:complete len:240 (-) Transcript_33516:436-1155(-)
MANPGGPFQVQQVDIDVDDHWGPYEHQAHHAAAQQRMEHLQQMVQALSQQVQQMGVQATQQVQQMQQQMGMQGAQQAACRDKIPTSPSLGSDKPEEDKHITTMVYTVWKRKIAVWIRQVEGLVPAERQAAMIAQELRGKSAETIWMGLNSDTDICHVDGLTRIQTLLDKHFLGDMTATITQRIDEAMSYKRSPTQPLDDFIRTLKLKLQNLDEVGEVLPMRVRANLLLTNSNMSETHLA